MRTVFLDTCFLINANNTDSLKDKDAIEKINYLLGVFYVNPDDYSFVVSKTVVCELLHVLERIGSVNYVSNQLVKSGLKTEAELKRMNDDDRKREIANYLSNNWLWKLEQFVKKWRTSTYNRDYDLYVLGDFKDIRTLISSLRATYVSNFSYSDDEVVERLIKMKSQIRTLDSNDALNCVMCEDQKIDIFLTLDYDFPSTVWTSRMSVINVRQKSKSELQSIFPQ